jgi:hypothetical protein
MEVTLVHSDQTDTPSAPMAWRDSGLMRSVNKNMRQRSEAPPADPIAFFCECRSASCYAPIWMSTAAFDAEADRPGWLLHEGHEPSVSWRPDEPLTTRPTPGTERTRAVNADVGNEVSAGSRRGQRRHLRRPLGDLPRFRDRRNATRVACIGNESGGRGDSAGEESGQVLASGSVG